MPFPIGVSVGDFIAGIDKLIEICKACREIGGAAEEYTSLFEDLNRYLEVFEDLKHRPLDIRPQSHDEAKLQSAVEACEVVAKKFLERLVGRYNERLGDESRSKGSASGMKKFVKISKFGRTVLYVLLMPDEIAAFRSNFDPKIKALQLQLKISDRRSVSNSIEEIRITQNQITTIDSNLNKVGTRSAAIHDQIQHNHGQVESWLNEIDARVRNVESKMLTTQQGETKHAISRITQIGTPTSDIYTRAVHNYQSLETGSYLETSERPIRRREISYISVRTPFGIFSVAK